MEVNEKGRIAGLAVVVAAVSALMAWALISAFNADQSRYGDLSGDNYSDDLEPPLEQDVESPGAGLKDEEAAVKTPAVKPASPAAANKADQGKKAEPAKP